MIRFLLVSLLWLGAFCALGQQNPFDLKYRRPAPITSPKPSTPVISPDTLALKPEPQTPTSSIDTSQALSDPADTSTSGLEDNPFELGKLEAEDSNLIIEEKTADPTTVTVPVNGVRRSSKGIQIFFLLLSLLFLIFIVNVERSFVRDLWKVISNENYSSLHLRNQRNTMRQILLLMGYMVFIIQAGIFLYHTLIIFNYTGTLLDNVWTCISLVLVVYLIRHMVIAYLRWLFNNEKEMTLFSFDISIFNIMVGLVLLPINVMINFGPESLIKPLIIIGLIIAAAAYLMRQLRWMLTGRQLITNSLFLFFVYLCAVEILPLWAISKYFW